MLERGRPKPPTFLRPGRRASETDVEWDTGEGLRASGGREAVVSPVQRVKGTGKTKGMGEEKRQGR